MDTEREADMSFERDEPNEPDGRPDAPGDGGQQRAGGSCAEAYEWAESFLVPLLLFLVVFVFFVRLATVNGISMEPTLHEGQRPVLRQIGYEPQYGDIVVVDRTQDGEEPLVKRVIGKAGDVIYIDFNTHEVWRNDELLDEPYINEPTALSGDLTFPTRVPEGCVFVMGDNRNHSLDSRDSSVGMVDERRVMGEAVFRIYPLDKIGGV